MCLSGYFGEICQYRCHCEDDADCNKNTGRCPNGRCAIGWAGSDCQQGKVSYVKWNELETYDVFKGINRRSDLILVELFWVQHEQIIQVAL